MSIVIRREQPGDSEAISSILESAFEGSVESQLVNQLRVNQATELSWVAELNGEVVAQILYTPSQIHSPSGSGEETQCLNGLGLAPLSVLPKYQNQGIGSLLMEETLKELENNEHDFIIVLGHPNFYKKFGFTPAVEYNVRCEFEGIPAEAIEEAFLILWKKVPALKLEEGLARYREEFYES